jgi:serine/threonine protein kinase
MKTRRSGGRRKQSVKRTKGGVYKGQGTYGCVFNPAIKCSDEAARRPGTISKLLDPEEADKEFSQYYALKGIDPQQKYLLWPLRLCEPEYQDPENNSSRCTISKNASKKPIDIRTIQPKVVLYKEGGVDLDNIVITGANIIHLLTGLRNLFRGLAVLHAADMAHLDIKLGNIVALNDPVSGEYKIRFIDFGLTKHVGEMAVLSKLDREQEAELQRRRDLLEEDLRKETERIEELRLAIGEAGSNAETQHKSRVLQEKVRNFESVNRRELLKIADKAGRMKYDHLTVYTSDYVAWPFELRFVHPLYKRFNIRDNIRVWYGKEYFTRDARNIPIWTWFDERGDAILETAGGKDILARAATAPVKNLIQASDIYALGRVIATMYSKCIGHTCTGPGQISVGRGSGAGAEQLRDRVSVPLYALVCRMMAPDMFTRPSALEAADQYEGVIAALRALYGHSAVLPDTLEYDAPTAVDHAHALSPRLVNSPLPLLPPSPNEFFVSPNSEPKAPRRHRNEAQSPRTVITPPKRRTINPSFFNPRAITMTRLPSLGLGSPSAKYTQRADALDQRLTLMGAKGFNSPAAANGSEPAARSGASSSGHAASDPKATSRP